MAVTCSFCGRAHPYFALTRHVFDSSESMLLCAECAEELRIHPQQPRTRVSASDLLAGLLDSAVEQMGTGECPECGRPLEELRRSGRAGCPNCYIHFQSVVTTHLKRLGKATRHMGRYPARLTRYRDFFQRRENLYEELEKAVSTEDYEGAAQLRDTINAITQRSASSPSDEAEGTADDADEESARQ